MDITLNINDTYCTNCYKKSIEKTETFSTRDKSVEIQNNYSLNVISVSNSTFSIIIQNGNCVIIRNVLK